MVGTNFQLSARDSEKRLIGEEEAHRSLRSPCRKLRSALRVPRRPLPGAARGLAPPPVLSIPSTSPFDRNKNAIHLYRKSRGKKIKSNLLFNVFTACFNLSVKEGSGIYGVDFEMLYEVLKISSTI